MNEEYAWHFAEIELAMRRPDTAQLVEALIDLLQQNMLSVETVTAIMAEDNRSGRFEPAGLNKSISITILSDQDIGEERSGAESEHPPFDRQNGQ